MAKKVKAKKGEALKKGKTPSKDKTYYFGQIKKIRISELGVRAPIVFLY